MEGNPTPTDKGIIPRAFEHIFKRFFIYFKLFFGFINNFIIKY